MLQVLYFSRDNAIDVSAEVCVDNGDLLGDLPNALVIKPGYYTIWQQRGGGLLLLKEGLYRIMDLENSRSFQVIVYKEKIFELFAALARIFMHGYTDHNCILDQWMQRAVFRNVLMECGPTATSIFKILQFLGIPCRIVGLNCYKNKYCGHVINEVFVNNQWILADFDRKIFMVDSQNQYLSLKDIILSNGFSSSEFEPMCKGSISSSGMCYDATKRGYLQNVGFLTEFYSLEFPKNLRDWYCSYDVFMNSENPIYEMFVCDSTQNPFKNHHLMQNERGKSYYKILPREEFLTKFYGE